MSKWAGATTLEGSSVLTKRGWKKNGLWTWIQPPPHYRGTSDNVAGMNPFAIGSARPTEGVAVGHIIRRVGRRTVQGAPVHYDPITWFERSGLVNIPSLFILGLPALGKSTLTRRLILGMAARGTTTLVLGDLKGEYVELIKALGGQVIKLGRGLGCLNVLEMGEAVEAARRLMDAGHEEAARGLLAQARARRQAALESLLAIHRGVAPDSRECSILEEALGVLDQRITRRTLLLSDLLKVLTHPTQMMHQVAVSHGDTGTYNKIIERLEADLTPMAMGKGLGEVFGLATTIPLVRNRSAVFDVSKIDEGDTKLRAAALVLSWSLGFSQIAVSHALADAGIEKHQPVNIVQDELWRALRAGTGLVARFDTLTRLDRDKGVSRMMISHTMEDLEALPDPVERAMAAGFVARSGVICLAGLPKSEMGRLDGVVRLSEIEKQTLQSWTTPRGWSTRQRRPKRDAEGKPVPRKRRRPPGQGNFLLKVGGGGAEEMAGIAFHLDPVPCEMAFNDTNKRWNMAA